VSERWPVHVADGHRFELLVEVPERPRVALLFACAMGVDASYYAPFAEARASEGVPLARTARYAPLGSEALGAPSCGAHALGAGSGRCRQAAR
jgi:hypothetical protein